MQEPTGACVYLGVCLITGIPATSGAQVNVRVVRTSAASKEWFTRTIECFVECQRTSKNTAGRRPPWFRSGDLRPVRTLFLRVGVLNHVHGELTGGTPDLGALFLPEQICSLFPTAGLAENSNQLAWTGDGGFRTTYEFIQTHPLFVRLSASACRVLRFVEFA